MQNADVTKPENVLVLLYKLAQDTTHSSDSRFP